MYTLRIPKYYKVSLLFLLGSNIVNIFNFLFNIAASRFLTPSDYGIVAVLLSASLVALVPASAITLLVIKYSSDKNNKRLISSLLFTLTLGLLPMTILILVVFIAFNKQIASFLNIKNEYVILMTGLFIFVSFLTPVTRGIMQGLRKFSFLALNLVLEAGLKLFLGIGFILLGYSVNGAVTGIVFAGFLGYAASFLPIKQYVNREARIINLRPLLKYLMPVLSMTMAITLFYNNDIILAKHFLNPEEAGRYSALALLSKVIFFSTTSLTSVMFATVCHNNKNSQQTLFKSLKLLMVTSFCFMLIYYIFSKQVVNIVIGEQYLEVSKYLWMFGLAASFMSIINNFANYFVAVNKNKVAFLLFAAILFQVIFIYIFHSSIQDIITVTLVTFFLLMVILLFSLKRKM